MLTDGIREAEIQLMHGKPCISKRSAGRAGQACRPKWLIREEACFFMPETNSAHHG
ncbi:Hypothetical protein AA314_02452 [Archangium gephyra]|uniref:Uncharacterized protein n=1 Tax=Archangium gephyra TaxID=48 RepID=A0AAC8TDP9_9BACT|nr:Hypothetical protein AA314_02452 [Archangium gephyra]